MSWDEHTDCDRQIEYWHAKYDALKQSHDRLVEAIKRGRKLYEDNEPQQMFLVWKQALADAENVK